MKYLTFEWPDIGDTWDSLAGAFIKVYRVVFPNGLPEWTPLFVLGLGAIYVLACAIRKVRK